MASTKKKGNISVFTLYFADCLLVTLMLQEVVVYCV